MAQSVSGNYHTDNARLSCWKRTVSLSEKLLIGGSAQTVNDKAHLTGRETAGARGVADGAQAVHQAGVVRHPPLELLPSGLGGYVGAIRLGKLSPSVLSHNEFHADGALTGCKDTNFLYDKSRNYRSKQDKTAQRATEPFP